jgi:RNA polymerase sigma-70 factor (ECF subfamily)
MTDFDQFEGFMRNYQDMVYSTAVRLLANPTDAEDVAQTVFLKAYEHFATLAHSTTAGGWLKTVTTNLCLNHLARYRSRWRLFSDLRSHEDQESDFVESVPAPDSFEQGLAEADYRRLLERAIAKLPAAQRVPLVLFHFEDRPYEDIARRLRVSLSKVKTDIHRGRLALKKYLQPRLSGDARWDQPASAPSAGASPQAQSAPPSARRTIPAGSPPIPEPASTCAKILKPLAHPSMSYAV